MGEYKKYRRASFTMMRPVTESDITCFRREGRIKSTIDPGFSVSISDADLQKGCPKIGDMIARNPLDHNDLWLVEEQYFNDNFIHDTDE